IVPELERLLDHHPVVGLDPLAVADSQDRSARDGILSHERLDRLESPFYRNGWAGVPGGAPLPPGRGLQRVHAWPAVRSPRRAGVWHLTAGGPSVKVSGHFTGERCDASSSEASWLRLPPQPAWEGRPGRRTARGPGSSTPISATPSSSRRRP